MEGLATLPHVALQNMEQNQRRKERANERIQNAKQIEKKRREEVSNQRLMAGRTIVREWSSPIKAPVKSDRLDRANERKPKTVAEENALMEAELEQLEARLGKLRESQDGEASHWRQVNRTEDGTAPSRAFVWSAAHPPPCVILEENDHPHNHGVMCRSPLEGRQANYQLQQEIHEKHHQQEPQVWPFRLARVA